MKRTRQKLNFPVNACAAILILCFLMAGTTALAQTFNSGSDGSDGALSLTVAGTYFFDPNDTTTFGRQLDVDGDGVFNFTTITIGAGVTLRFTGDHYNRPVYWLASGNVTINGTLDLNGANGSAVTTLSDLEARRKVSVPGAGGFAGGPGGTTGTPASPADIGDGPGGGTMSATCSPNTCGQGGTFTGTNKYLVPLIGGSGGQGGVSATAIDGGGAGGGAILISSSGSITLSAAAAINAKGGTGGNSVGGSGSGGAIRLAAKSIDSPVGKLNVAGVTTGPAVTQSSNGKVRIEAFQVTTSGVAAPSWDALASPATAASSGFPTNSFVSTASVRIVSINGVAVPAAPAGSFFQPPDITINNTVPVPVAVQANGIPVNTPILVQVYSDNPDDPLTVTKTYNSNLDSNLQATVNVPFPTGLSRCYIRVTWLQ